MMLTGTSRLIVRGVQLASLLALLGYAAQAAFTVFGTGADRFFEIYVYNALIFAAGGLCIGRAAVSRRERGPWLVLGIGLLAWAASEAYYSLFLDRLDSPPVPSVSDGLWLAFYPACYVAIVLLVRERVRQFRSSLWLDGVLGALAASAIAAALIFGTVVGRGEDGSVIAVDLAYAIGDLLLLGFVVAMFGLTGWRPGRALLLVGAALVTSAIVDGWFLYTLATGQAVETTLVATLWPASALLLGFAAWQRPAEVQPIRLEGWRVLLMPSAFAVSGLALLGYHTIERQNVLALALAVATLAAVIVRMAVTFHENIDLLDSSRREALTDALTGLRNRRALIGDLEEAAAGARAEDPIALVILDLDGFKQYNDRFGHPMGDALLVRLARKLEVAAGRFDARVYRLGGDEFCVLTAADHARAFEVATAAQSALSERGRGLRHHEHLRLRPAFPPTPPMRPMRCESRTAGCTPTRTVAGAHRPAARPAPRCCRRCRSASPNCGTTSTRSPGCRCRSATSWVCRDRSSTTSPKRLTCTTSARWACRTRSCRSPAAWMPWSGS